SDLLKLRSFARLPEAEKAAVFLTPADEQRIDIPRQVSGQWIEDNKSFVYLAGDLDLIKLPEKAFGMTVILHSKLDAPFPHPKSGPVIVMGFPDGHAELFPVKDAEAQIEASVKTLKTVRD